MIDRILKKVFWVAVAALVFMYGFVSHWKQLFPYQTVVEASVALSALSQVIDETIVHKNSSDGVPLGVEFWEASTATGPTTNIISSNTGNENLLFLGNRNAHKHLCPDVGCLAWLMDREGRVLHVWKNTPDLWAPLQNRSAVGNTWSAYPVGAYLYDNGALLVSYQGNNVFPIAMGLAKFDKDSNLLWKRDGFYHHWFSVGPEGNIYIGGGRIVSSPLSIKGHEKYFACEQKRFFYEPIIILDSEGKQIDEIDTLEAIIASDLVGLFNNNGKNPDSIETCDPLHLNDVRILSKEHWQRSFPPFRKETCYCHSVLLMA